MPNQLADVMVHVGWIERMIIAFALEAVPDSLKSICITECTNIDALVACGAETNNVDILLLLTSEPSFDQRFEIPVLHHSDELDRRHPLADRNLLGRDRRN